MIEDPDEMQPEDPDDLRREIREQGARVAYAALLGVCRDPKAPAPAKATAGTTLLRVGGFLDRVEVTPDDGLSKLSDAEIAKLTSDLRAQVEAMELAMAAEGSVAGTKRSAKATGAPERKPGAVDLFD